MAKNWKFGLKKKYSDIYNNIIMFSFDQGLHFLQIVVSFNPVAIHDVLPKFRRWAMFKNAARLFNQVIGRFSIK